MKSIFTFICLISAMICYAQIDKDQLALDVSKADADNTEKLKAFIWKRHSTATVEGEVKATLITEFKFDEKGELQAEQVGGETSVKQKRGIRGKVQANAMEDNTDYIEKALKLALAYTYMSKGQLLDFFGKATITEAGGVTSATAESVYMDGDKLTVQFDSATKLFISKTFSGKLEEDPISGEIKYAKFSSGINHGATTVLNLPAKKAVITAKNQDYSQRVQ